jgi:hypothetical protein
MLHTSSVLQRVYLGPIGAVGAGIHPGSGLATLRALVPRFGVPVFVPFGGAGSKFSKPFLLED